MSWWIVETLVTVTLLMVVVLALRAPVARMFGAGWAYALWAIPALRLVLPPLPLITPEIVLPTLVAPAAVEGAAASPFAEQASLSGTALLLAIWAGGAILFLTLQWLGYRAFVRRLRAEARPARPDRHGGIATLISRAVDGPVALGFLERLIVLPSDFSRRYGPVERRLAIEHELTHHRRRDTWWNLTALVVLALNWFNPIAWIAFRAFREDQELSCDAAVAAAASPEERHDYALAMVKSASAPGLIAACPMGEAKRLKRRLRMMRSHRASPARRAGGTIALTALATAGFAVGTPAVVREAAPEAAAPVMVAAAPAPALEASPATPAVRFAAVAAPATAAKPTPSRRAAPARAKVAVRPAPAPAPAPRFEMAEAEMRLAGAVHEMIMRHGEGKPAPHAPGVRVRVVEGMSFAAAPGGKEGKAFFIVGGEARPLDREARHELRRAIARAEAIARRRGVAPAIEAGPGGNFNNIQIFTIVEQGEARK